jgi:hypothetical protein
MNTEFCKAIVNANNGYRNNKRPCCNYARKGFVSCYSHRKIETPEYEAVVVKDFVKAAINNVIYNNNMDYIRKHGWDEYCLAQKKGEI